METTEETKNAKYQTRSRARKNKMIMSATGGGPEKKIKITKLEERAFEAFGAVAVDGLPNAPSIGMNEPEKLCTIEPLKTIEQYMKTDNTEEPNITTAIETETTEPNTVHQNNSQPRKTKTKMDGSSVLRTILRNIEERVNMEQNIRERQIESETKLADAIDNMVETIRIHQERQINVQTNLAKAIFSLVDILKVVNNKQT